MAETYDPAITHGAVPNPVLTQHQVDDLITEAVIGAARRGAAFDQIWLAVSAEHDQLNGQEAEARKLFATARIQALSVSEGELPNPVLTDAEVLEAYSGVFVDLARRGATFEQIRYATWSEWHGCEDETESVRGTVEKLRAHALAQIATKADA